MNFEVLLFEAKEGKPEATLKIVEMYKPLLFKNAVVDGIFDEDLYQELMRVLLMCIRRFRIL